MRYKSISDRYMRALRLETPPVAVLFSTAPPPGLERIELDRKGCMYLDVARFERRSFWTDAQHHAQCKNGRYYLGLSGPFEGLECGDWPAGEYPSKGRKIFKTPAAYRRTYPHYTVVPSESVKYISYGPLDDVEFIPEQGGMVVVIFCSAKQGLYLARAAIFESGGVIEGPIGPATCSMVMSKPLLTGEIVYTLGCFGFRQFVKIKGEEVVFGIPFEKLEGTIDNLEMFLQGRPDLKDMLAEPPAAFHVATARELEVQKAPGDVVVRKA